MGYKKTMEYLKPTTSMEIKWFKKTILKMGKKRFIEDHIYSKIFQKKYLEEIWKEIKKYEQ